MEWHFSYTITVFTADEEAKRFVTWYKESWLKKNPKMDDFTLTFETDDDLGEVLEVMAHNPFISVEVLMDIFRTESGADVRLQPESSSIN